MQDENRQKTRPEDQTRNSWQHQDLRQKPATKPLRRSYSGTSIFSCSAAARSLCSARASIWRIRSLVTPSWLPTS